MDGRITAKIMTEIDGGWLREETFGASAAKVVEVMARFQKALAAKAVAEKEAVVDAAEDVA